MLLAKYINCLNMKIILPAITLTLIFATATTFATDDRGHMAENARERGQLARSFVIKWGHHAQRSHGIAVSAWAKKLTPAFAHGDIERLREALNKIRYAEAIAVVDAISPARHGRSPRREASDPISFGMMRVDAAKALGSYDKDLSYTPLQPCRIVDTRVAGGPIGAGQSRAFNALAAPGGNFTSQGGMGHDCQALTTSEAAAVAINVTSVGPSFAGYATVFPYGFARPATASLNYTAGGIVNNTVVTRIPTPIAGKDFTIFSLASAEYVVDIVGYFAPPASTELSTTTVTASKEIFANSTGFVAYSPCPSGFARTGGFCFGAGYAPNVYLKETGPASCIFYNGSSQQETFTAMTQCAKIPGK